MENYEGKNLKNVDYNMYFPRDRKHLVQNFNELITQKKKRIISTILSAVGIQFTLN